MALTHKAHFRPAPSRLFSLCTLVLASLLGSGSAFLDKIKKAAEDAKSGIDDAIDTIGDAFQTTGDWAEGTWEDAGKALDKATGEVENRVEDVKTIVESVREDPEKAKELLVIALPTCTDIKYIVRRELNATMTSTIDDLFALQECLEDVHSDACLEALKRTLVAIMFSAMWFPLTQGIGLASPVVKAGVELLASPARNLLYPPLGVAAQPLAKAVHELLKGADFDTTTANAVVLEVKDALLELRDETLRATETSMNQVCAVVHPGSVGSADGSCQLVPTWAAASLLAAPLVGVDSRL